MIDTGLKNKVVIMTGANHGIGAATAIGFAKEGARVFVHYFRQSPEKFGETQSTIEKATEPGRAFYCKMAAQSAAQVEETISKLRGKCCSWEADLSYPEKIPAMFDLAEDHLGPVEIIVNNAAVGNFDTFLPQAEIDQMPLFAEEYVLHSLSAHSHDEHFAVNSRAVALIITEFAGRVIKRDSKWGRIINITTDGARCHAMNVSYGASKYAIESFTRSAATELGPYGITVNVISPGAVQTGWLNQKMEAKIAASYPLRRIGKPEDIANSIIFFASKQADWITGQVLYVGGGNRM